MAHFTTSDGLSLYFTDEGAGLPILCLAGLTRTTADFDYVTPHLKGVRLIKMDYRGRGQSDFDPDWSHYSPPIECRDALELLDHLGIDKAAVLGTSRGGLNALGLAKGAKDRLLGVAFNDVGPHIDPQGLDFIMGYIGRNPAADSRWMEEAQKHYTQTESGLQITYDKHLRDAVAKAFSAPSPDLWPFFDALDGLPIACIRGMASNLLSEETLQEMERRRPDMVVARVPGRGHIPFLDEPEAVAALNEWIGKMQ